MAINFKEVITDFCALHNGYVLRDGFVFTAVTHPANVFDAIVIKFPKNVECFSPYMIGSEHSLTEQIEFINQHKIEKALIISESIDFITRCPTLKHLYIIPADSTGNGFDYSPVYKMPQIKSVSASTIYGLKEEYFTHLDCSRIVGLESVSVTNSYYHNYADIKTLKDLGLSHYKENDLSNAFCSVVLDTLVVIQSKIKTLNGIQKSPRMQCLYLYHNRNLEDISALYKVKKTLKALSIENCSKVNDFSVLGELENLEFLMLCGSNELPNLSFINKMKSLKTFVFDMNVKDGDLSPCIALSYVSSSKDRRHYNFKNKDLPKGEYVRGNENIELWRRFL